MENIKIESQEEDNNIVESTKEKYEALDEKVRNEIRKELSEKDIRKRLKFFKNLDNEKTQKDLSILKNKDEYREFVIQDLVLDVHTENIVYNHMQEKFGDNFLEKMPEMIEEKQRKGKESLDKIFGPEKSEK